MAFDNNLGQSSIMLDWSSPSSFVIVPMGSMSLPKLSQCGASAPTHQSNFTRPRVSSQTLHDVFYLPPVGTPTDLPTTPKKRSSNCSSTRTLELSEDDTVLQNHGFDRLDTFRTRDL
ncbi:hypothetical protein PF010_g31744 [Phytophthora fragariae]|uniref:Uncharacterized protein n=4 Tax=Phytophthora fragariae TaxID=53985 RepID=A0A6A3DFA5_9STRA|nr:hypothetical protein PF009_g32098 [Phytophthora fragariae]KAE9056500.1 hypothetical protein PF010_g31744 [Phytophthora fragariae]KAE9057329.1 hypothetical protein PF007_g31683 [Phytophthora fragariae]KAE9059130.1 hypothetical protein PF006_g31959 [Phytophthora fragariae]KAE9159763.1 hypothetical protein PF004_g31414 [Phytophthora fragariae]